MKLYLSSYRIPSPNDLAKLLGKPLKETSVAFIPNAIDYYIERARNVKVGGVVEYLQQLGLTAEVIDLRNYDNPDALKAKLANHDLIWAMGGNTYMLRYEMRRSGFENIIGDLLNADIAYGGDSAGALVAGVSIAGVESSDEPEFAEEVIQDGLGLVPFAILPHIDNPEFADVLPIFRNTHEGKNHVIELKDSQAAIFDGADYCIVEGRGIKE
jgi:dipeptidase E